MKTSATPTVFDEPESLAINRARMDAIADLLQLFPIDRPRSAIDVGCGVGYFSKFLANHGFDVLGVDVRDENIQEAHRRYPDIRFDLHDIEDPRVGELGQFELVLCTGILYHLENPFRAIRNIAKLAARIVIIESVVIPGKTPAAVLVNELSSPDQAREYVALVPSESAMACMFASAGLNRVYRVRPQPNHADFRASVLRQRLRVMLVCAREDLTSDRLERFEGMARPPDPWRRSGPAFVVVNVVRRAVRSFWRRSSIASDRS